MILKQNQIFDNINLASKPRVIKVSSKSDMSIIWIDIWDIQSGSKAKGLITDTSTLAIILQLLGVLIWIRVYLNVKTARNGVMWCFLAESKNPSALSAMVLTSWKITVNLDSAARRMKKQILLDSKQRKRNHAYICSNVQTVMVTTKLTQIYVHSGGIDSIRSGNRRSMLRSVKTGSSRFALWEAVSLKNDHTKP